MKLNECFQVKQSSINIFYEGNNKLVILNVLKLSLQCEWNAISLNYGGLHKL